MCKYTYYPCIYVCVAVGDNMASNRNQPMTSEHYRAQKEAEWHSHFKPSIKCKQHRETVSVLFQLARHILAGSERGC